MNEGKSLLKRYFLKIYNVPLIPLVKKTPFLETYNVPLIPLKIAIVYKRFFD